MKILAALSRFPWPLEKGDKLRAYYQLRDLAKAHEIHLVCLNEEQVSSSDLAQLDFCSSVQVISLSKFRIFRNLVGGVFNKLPFQVNYFNSPEMKKVLAQTIQREKIDVVMVQLIRLGMNLPFASTQTGWFLDYMDCFSIGMQLRKARSQGLRKWVVGMEAERLGKYETKIASKFDELGIISDRDAEGLAPILQEATHILPNGVGDHFFEALPSPTEKSYDLIFFGNMGYQPNVESAHFLVEQVLPELERLGIRPKLCIAGARPAKSIQAFANDQIEVTGFVDDLRTYAHASRLSITPVIGGQGLQNKLLESMAMGLPTLSSPLAHAAVPAEAGRELIVCDSPADFAREIKRLLENPAAADQIGQAGKAFVEKHFRWEAMNRKLEAVLKKASQA